MSTGLNRPVRTLPFILTSMKHPILAALLVTFTTLSHAAWELNDVSYLMALPKKAGAKTSLLKTKGLFPQSHSQYFEDFVMGPDRPNLNDFFEPLRVVSMRIDPCFKFTDLKNEKCNSQLRLIWQPIMDEGKASVKALDAAVHGFFALSPNEFKALSKKLQDLKSKNQKSGIFTKHLPLAVHPAYANSSRAEDFHQELKDIITTFASEKNLVRFTFMKLATTDIWWTFGGMDKNKDGTWSDLKIPRLDPSITKQEFFNDAHDDGQGMKGTIIPEPIDEKNNISTFITGWGLSEETMKRSIVSMNRIENPRIFHPANMDCVHCHITGPTRIWMESKHPQLLKKTQNAQDFYSSIPFLGHNITNVTFNKKNNKSLRSFGYFGSAPSINQRVINESAAVADDLNAGAYIP